MKSKTSRILTAMLAAIMLLSALCIGAAAAGVPSPVITSYNSNMKTISMGQRANIDVYVKDINIAANELSDVSSQIDVNHLVDSFTGGTVSVEADPNATGSQLCYIVKFEGLIYSGTGNELSFMVGYNGKYTNLSVSVTQAEPYIEEGGGDIYSPEAIVPPTVLVSRGDIAEPVKAGDVFDVELTFENLSMINLSNVIVTYSVSEPLLMDGGRSSFVLDDIGGKKSLTTTVRLKAMDSISSSNLSFGVELKYTYFNNISTVSDSVSERINVPAKATNGAATIPEPPVLITRTPLSPISAGQEFEVEIAFQNAGKTALVSPVASFSTSESLVLQNENSTMVLPDIPAGEGYSVKLKIKAASDISSTTQSVSADLKFHYDNGSGLVQTSTSERLNISANTTGGNGSQTDSPVPNLIISAFDFGGDSAQAGSEFELSFTFKNTGVLGVENIVVVVDGGESFTMVGSTNTFYYKSMPAGGETTLTVPMQTLATARTGAQNVNISFRYEYVDNQRRASSSSDIKLSVPVVQPDRLQIDEPTLYDMAYAGMETTIVMSYVNKGKSDLSNVEVTIEGDVDALQQTQYLGNFSSGQSGNISFVVTPYTAGDVELLIKVIYEDANLQTVVREFPLTLNVQEMSWGWEEPIMPVEPEDTDEKSNGLGFWLWIIIAAGVVVVVVVIIVIAKKRKKKKAAALLEDSEWDSWDDEKESVTAGGNKEE